MEKKELLKALNEIKHHFEIRFSKNYQGNWLKAIDYCIRKFEPKTFEYEIEYDQTDVDSFKTLKGTLTCDDLVDYLARVYSEDEEDEFLLNLLDDISIEETYRLAEKNRDEIEQLILNDFEKEKED